MAPVELQAYLLSLGPPQSTYDHSMCTSLVCMGSQMGPYFKPKHLHQDCLCDFISTPMEELVDILRTGHIPVLTVAESPDASDAPIISVMPSTPDKPYIALSHLWADGLGNPVANAIHRCQLENISGALQGLSSVSPDASGVSLSFSFWLDTLCIPVEEIYHELRDFSIQKMRDIYKDAYAVLVVDSDLRAMTRTTSDLEVLGRVLVSGWNARLWTYQEAALGEELIIRGKDCIFFYDDLVRKYTSSSSQSQATISNSLERIVASCCRQHVPRRTPVLTEKSDEHVQELFYTITNRVTSRRDDETVCIATYLGLDPSKLLKAPSMERIRILLEMLPNIPANVLFSGGRRIEHQGFYWAPRTFLASDHYNKSELVKRPIYNTSPQTSRPMSYLHPDRLGLVTFLPAIQLQRLDLSTFRQSGSFILHMAGGEHYLIGFGGDYRSLALWTESHNDLAILLPFHGGPVAEDHVHRESEGVLVRLSGETAEPCPFHCKTGPLSVADYMVRVVINDLVAGAVPPNIQLVDGKLTSPKWWVVDGEPYHEEWGRPSSPDEETPQWDLESNVVLTDIQPGESPPRSEPTVSPYVLCYQAAVDDIG